MIGTTRANSMAATPAAPSEKPQAAPSRLSGSALMRFGHGTISSRLDAEGGLRAVSCMSLPMEVAPATKRNPVNG